MLVLLLSSSLTADGEMRGAIPHGGSKPIRLLPTLEYLNGTQIVWQMPAATKAVLFIAHGCYCRATFFWDRHPDCEECIGLPEERVLILDALAKHYAVLAISSKGHCWSEVGDAAKVRSTLEYFIRQRSLQGLPVVALGASSGGYFISTFALQFKFVALVVMIAEGAIKEKDIDRTYPPTLFVHMLKDAKRAYLVQKAMELLSSKGVLTAEVKCPEIPLTPHFFSERIPDFDQKLSESIYTLLRENGFVDQSGFLKENSRAMNWQMSVKKRGVLPEDRSGKLKWEHHIQEELNLAYGYHEMTSLQSDIIFEWFDLHVSKFNASR
ncbi:hypothetical protein O6H91_09G005400 [Diphasiastrum complanatum]|nr:hypothetical protein O6H91_09G005400 [Diphasiastrum complanatum]